MFFIAGLTPREEPSQYRRQTRSLRLTVPTALFVTFWTRLSTKMYKFVTSERAYLVSLHVSILRTYFFKDARRSS